MELPDFHIPHAEKIEWMIETHGWAMEPVAARTDTDPPVAGYVYTIGYPEAFGFPEVLVFGLTPSAARGLFDMIADLLRGGTEIPLGVELAGLFDNDLRCVFAPLDDERGTVLLGHRRRLAQGCAVRRRCSCCGPTATASCPPSPASTSAWCSPSRWSADVG